MRIISVTFEIIDSNEMGVLVFAGTAFIFMLYVFAPQLFLGLVAGGCTWHAWNNGAGNLRHRIRRNTKVYIKRTHKGHRVENNPGASLNRGDMLETRLSDID